MAESYLQLTVCAEEDEREGVAKEELKDRRYDDDQAAEPEECTTASNQLAIRTCGSAYVHIRRSHELLIRTSPSHQCARQRGESDSVTNEGTFA